MLAQDRQSSERRHLIELALYPLLGLLSLIAIWQFAQQAINIPPARVDTGCVVCVDEMQTQPEVGHSEIKRIEKSSQLAETW